MHEDPRQARAVEARRHVEAGGAALTRVARLEHAEYVPRVIEHGRDEEGRVVAEVGVAASREARVANAAEHLTEAARALERVSARGDFAFGRVADLAPGEQVRASVEAIGDLGEDGRVGQGGEHARAVFEADRFVDRAELEPERLRVASDAVHHDEVGREGLCFGEQERTREVPEDRQHHRADLDLTRARQGDHAALDRGLRRWVVDLAWRGRLRLGVRETREETLEDATRRVLADVQEAPEARHQHARSARQIVDRARLVGPAARRIAGREGVVRDVLSPGRFALGVDDDVVRLRAGSRRGVAGGEPGEERQRAEVRDGCGAGHRDGGAWHASLCDGAVLRRRRTGPRASSAAA